MEWKTKTFLLHLRVQLHVSGNGNVLVAGEDVLDAALQVWPDLLQVDLFQARGATVAVRTAAVAATASPLHLDTGAGGGRPVCAGLVGIVSFLSYAGTLIEAMLVVVKSKEAVEFCFSSVNQLESIEF